MLKNVNVENILMEKGVFKVNMTLIESSRVKISQFYINRKLIQRGGRAAGYVTFLPLVELDPDVEGGVSERTVPAAAWGEFLCTIFDEWLRRDIEGIKVQIFGSARS